LKESSETEHQILGRFSTASPAARHFYSSACAMPHFQDHLQFCSATFLFPPQSSNDCRNLADLALCNACASTRFCAEQRETESFQEGRGWQRSVPAPCSTPSQQLTARLWGFSFHSLTVVCIGDTVQVNLSSPSSSSQRKATRGETTAAGISQLISLSLSRHSV